MTKPRFSSILNKKAAVIRFILFGVLTVMATNSSRASILVDNMSNTSGFFAFSVVEFANGVSTLDPPGYLLPTATENGNNSVTLSNHDVHLDTNEDIVDWTMPNGGSDPYMDIASDDLLQLNLLSVGSSFQYGVNLLFFGSGSNDPAFVAEVPWLVSANSTDLSPSVDVSTLAPVGASQYFVRFRLLPPDQAGDAITLSSIVTTSETSVPEPGGLSLVVVGLMIFGGSRFAATRSKD
jgi:hypothetical protein